MTNMNRVTSWGCPLLLGAILAWMWIQIVGTCQAGYTPPEKRPQLVQGPMYLGGKLEEPLEYYIVNIRGREFVYYKAGETESPSNVYKHHPLWVLTPLPPAVLESK